MGNNDTMVGLLDALTEASKDRQDRSGVEATDHRFIVIDPNSRWPDLHNQKHTMKKLLLPVILATALLGAAGCPAPCKQPPTHSAECIEPDGGQPEPIGPQPVEVVPEQRPESATEFEAPFSDAFSGLSKSWCESSARAGGLDAALPAVSGEFTELSVSVRRAPLPGGRRERVVGRARCGSR